MKRLLNKFMVMAMLSSTIMLTHCSDDEDSTPSAPQVSPEVSQLSVAQSEVKSFTVSISAAGKLKDITATADKGTVTVTDITGTDQATGSAKINYTAPLTLGSAIITIIVNDKAEQQVKTDIAVDVTQHAPIEVAAGNVEGEWGPYLTYHVTGSLTIPEGKSLKVREGTTIIMDGDGKPASSPSIVAIGNFYSYGTQDKPVLFTVPEAKRTKANIFAGLWGGILATAKSTEMLVLYTRIEYTGLPGVKGTDIVDSGEVAEGDPTYALYFTNPNGKVVIMNSTIAYTVDVAVQINQGSLLVANNTFILNGKSGGESINLKSGAVGDIAFNTFYSSATNGVKWSNSGDRSPQNNANVYNNTAVNCGWRQTKAGRGGSFNLEKGGRGQVYNNIVANSKYGVRFPNTPDNPDLTNSKVGYNLYFGNNDESITGFYPSTGSITKGSFETTNDISGAKGENDPKFVTFDVTTFDATAAKNSSNVDFPAAFNFKLQAGSPALTKGKTGFTTNFTNLSLDGKAYTVPAPASYIGAYGN